MTPPALIVRYEDPALLVVEKPAGVHTAPLQPGETGTLVDMVIRSYPEVAALPGIKPVEPGLVHRLDRDTSGLVVVARTPEAFDSLRRCFESGGARKQYLAACRADQVPQGPLRVESRFAPFGPGRAMVRAVFPGERSRRLLKSASGETYVTEARVTARGNGRVMIAASIRKGFRHQVRVHLAVLGFPILGDLLYGTAAPAGFPTRMYLHASRIDFRHPESGRPLGIESPLPAEFTGLFDEGKER
ncbi:MAG: RluA family pseudouridine synthase [Spirochaetia bacterium]